MTAGAVVDRVPDAERGETVRLREGAEHDDVGATRPAEHPQPVDRFGVGDELGVGLVEKVPSDVLVILDEA